jgi:hypothetical protein
MTTISQDLITFANSTNNKKRIFEIPSEDSNNSEEYIQPLKKTKKNKISYSSTAWLDIINTQVMENIYNSKDIIKLMEINKEFRNDLQIKNIQFIHDTNLTIDNKHKIQKIVILDMFQDKDYDGDYVPYLSNLSETLTDLTINGYHAPLFSVNDCNTFSSLTKVNKLRLENFYIESDDIDFINVINKIPNLKCLELQCKNISNIYNILEKKNITDLKISKICYDDTDEDSLRVKSFSFIEKFSSTLQNLILEFDDYNFCFYYLDFIDDIPYDEYIDSLKNTFKTLEKLETITIKNTYIYDRDFCNIIDIILSIPNIKNICFENCNIEHPRFLLQLSNMRSINNIEFIRCGKITEKNIVESLSRLNQNIVIKECTLIRDDFESIITNVIKPNIFIKRQNYYNKLVKNNPNLPILLRDFEKLDSFNKNLINNMFNVVNISILHKFRFNQNSQFITINE